MDKELVTSDEGDLAAESVISDAESALYHAKNNGRNQASAIAD